MADRKYVTPKSRADWRRWLERHHKSSPSVWLVIFKKGSGKENLSVLDASEEALCFGWIDSLPGKMDEERFKLLVSPRKSGSSWSKVNRERVSRLIRAGQMTPPGLAKIEEAKRDGSWTRLDAVERLEIPPDLQRAFGRAKKAGARFLSFSPSSRRGILEWLQTAKRPETRATRILEIVEMAALGLRANFPVDRKKLRPKP